MNKVLFVGSFKEKAADGSVGGQMFACRTLVSSDLKNSVDFILIDTTSISVPAPPPYKRIPATIKRLYKLIKNLITNKIDTAIIFSSSGLSLKEKGLMVIISNLFKVKTIFAPRSGLIIEETERSAFTRFYLRRVIRTADTVLCQGNNWKNFFSQYDPYHPEKFKVVLNWIDVNKYGDVYRERLTKQKVPNAPVKILYLGWLESYKGILDFFEVFKNLVNAGYNVSADVCGSGNLHVEIIEKTDEHNLSGVFNLLGWADESVKLKALKEADIFVLPSYAEGIPNSLIEAMTAGIACVSTNVGGVPDLIEQGKNGLMFNPGDVDSLYSHIVQLYDDKDNLRDRMGSAAHNFALENCSVKYAVNFFNEIL